MLGQIYHVGIDIVDRFQAIFCMPDTDVLDGDGGIPAESCRDGGHHRRMVWDTAGILREEIQLIRHAVLAVLHNSYPNLLQILHLCRSA